MNKTILTENLNSPVTREQLIIKYCTNKDVLDIGCVNHDLLNTSVDNWLHNKIKKVSKKLIGMDYLLDEVDQLKKEGFNIIHQDVCKSFSLNKLFDVIVIGNLIEHVSNFEGLLENVRNHLSSDGVILISTANPFFIEQYFYSAYKNDIIVNEEHTCWIDPVTLNQLAKRFNLTTDKVFYISEKWNLSQIIMNGTRYNFDIYTSRWAFLKDRNLIENILIRIVKPFILIFYHNWYLRLKKDYNYTKDPDRVIVIKIYTNLFNYYWTIRKLFIPKALINSYELYFSVLKFKTL